MAEPDRLETYCAGNDDFAMDVIELLGAIRQLRSERDRLREQIEEKRTAYSKSALTNLVEGLNIFQWRDKQMLSEREAEALKALMREALADDNMWSGMRDKFRAAIAQEGK